MIRRLYYHQSFILGNLSDRIPYHSMYFIKYLHIVDIHKRLNSIMNMSSNWKL